MLVQEVELDILDLNYVKKKVVKIREDEICSQGFRIDQNGKVVGGVPIETKLTTTDFVTPTHVIHCIVLIAH